MNELRDEIKRVIEEIAQTKHIIKIGRSKSKKDMKELDRLIDGCKPSFMTIFNISRG